MRESGSILRLYPPPPHHSGLKSYSEVVLDRAAVLNSLILWLSGKHNAPYFKELLKKLSKFIKVKNIDIRINHSMDLHSLELVLGSRYYYSQLEEVTFNAFNSRPFSTFKPTNKTKELSSVHPDPNIKIFKREHLIFTDHSLKYLIHKFPGLNKLILREDGFIQQNRPTVSPSVMNDFIQYISRIKSLDITVNVSGDIIALVKKLIQPVFGNNFPKITVNYLDYEDEDEVYHHRDEDDTDWQIPNITHLNIRKNTSLYAPKSNKNSESNGVIEVCVAPGYAADPPHIKLVADFKDKLQDLELEYSPNSRDDNENDYSKVSNKSLETIIKTCKSLKTLTLNTLDVCISNPKKPFKNKSIETLNLKYCDFDQATLTSLSARLAVLKNLTLHAYIRDDMENDWSYRTYVNMPHISFEGIRWTDNEYYCPSKDGSYVKIYLKISGDIGEKYYVLDGSGNTLESSEAEFSENHVIDDYKTKKARHSMHIRCKEIKNITTEFLYSINYNSITKTCHYVN